MYFKKQLTKKETEYNLGYVYVEPKTKKYEIPPTLYELNDISNAFKGTLEIKSDEKAMKTSLETVMR